MNTASLALASLALFVTACGGNAGTAPGNRFFLPTGTVGTNVGPPSVEVDAHGTIHSVYPAYIGGGAFYAECSADCRGPGDMRVATLPTSDTVLNAMLALDADGQPQVLMVTREEVLYATCAGDCGASASWTVSSIDSHGGSRDVTGEAFALDPAGHPRFVMHTHIAYLGIGQQDPATGWAQCDANCHDASGWTHSQISGQILARNSLRIDARGRAHLATAATVVDPDTHLATDVVAYETCAADCGNPASWSGASFGPAFRAPGDAITVEEATSLVLTRDGAPRVLFLAAGANGARNLAYLECNASQCDTDAAWTAQVITSDSHIGPGYDLALDAQDHPRFVYTLDYNIGLGSCNDTTCATPDAHWHLTPIEGGEQIPKDGIFLYPNCSVGAWLLHDPSLAIAPDGRARVTYNARDVSSGGVYATDPSGPACSAGTDMVLGRIALIESL